MNAIATWMTWAELKLHYNFFFQTTIKTCCRRPLCSSKWIEMNKRKITKESCVVRRRHRQPNVISIDFKLAIWNDGRRKNFLIFGTLRARMASTTMFNFAWNCFLSGVRKSRAHNENHRPFCKVRMSCVKRFRFGDKHVAAAAVAAATTHVKVNFNVQTDCTSASTSQRNTFWVTYYRRYYVHYFAFVRPNNQTLCFHLNILCCWIWIKCTYGMCAETCGRPLFTSIHLHLPPVEPSECECGSRYNK